MPLRNLPGWYSWMALAGTMFLSVGIGVGVNIEIAHRQQEQTQQAQRQAQEQTRLATCLVASTQLSILEDPTVPQTESRTKAAAAWRSLSGLLRCG